MYPRRPGIRDVADAAGVSVTTVSHVLNNVESARVSQATRERVQREADRLGYVGSPISRGFAQRSSVIGFLSEDIATTPHAGQIILGAQRAARAHDLTLMLISTERGASTERELAAMLERRVAGVLYATMFHRQIEVPGELVGTKTVLVDASSVGRTVPSVVPDEFGGAVAAVNELLEFGHRRIGFLNNVDDVPATHGRLAGYRSALAGRGIEYDPSIVTSAVSETSGGYEAALRLLRTAEGPRALFCYNDRMAMGAYRAAAELGLRIPDQLSIVGYDNQTIIAEALFPQLTTVALPHYDMGVWAVDALVDLLEGARSDVDYPVRMPCALVRRSSVALPSAR